MLQKSKMCFCELFDKSKAIVMERCCNLFCVKMQMKADLSPNFQWILISSNTIEASPPIPVHRSNFFCIWSLNSSASYNKRVAYTVSRWYYVYLSLSYDISFATKFHNFALKYRLKFKVIKQYKTLNL